MAAATSTRRSMALADCSPSSASAVSLAAVTVTSEVASSSREELASGERGLRGLEPLHDVEHDLFEIGLPAVQRLDFRLEVLQFTRGVDHAAVEPISVAVDPGSDLLDVGLGLGLLAPQVAVLGGQLGDGVAQFAILRLERGKLGVFGKAAAPVLDPGELGIDVC